MQIAHLDSGAAYLSLLRTDEQELRALADDFLITVTSFFRDPEVFETLATQVIPAIFDSKQADEAIRVWAVGCATGEESYSLAILLLEEAARRDVDHRPRPRIQVFASDLHATSLQLGREGFYPGDIATDVPEQYLSRYFHKEDGGYRVRKEVRELIVFAPHNLLSDPPFSKLDIITCRNVLIYLERDVQREIIDLFHYALVPGGMLALGMSETLDATDLFAVVQKERCLWRKRNVPVPAPRLPVFPLVAAPARRSDLAGTERDQAITYAGLHQQLLDQAAPSLLIGPENKVVHLSGTAGRFLAPAGGEPSFDVFRLVRDELKAELRACVYDAREGRRPVISRPLHVQFNGAAHPVVMHVQPELGPDGVGHCLVVFEEHQPTEGDPANATETPSSSVHLDLEATRQRLQTIIEEHETSQEELKASNEELQSANEELRSTLEELETSKEELQSMNEELQTVNQENRHKVEELSQTSGDLQNLMASTDIATLFLDRSLRILRFTPNVSSLFSIRPADRGRPLSDLTHRLNYVGLRTDAETVLRQLTPIEREVEDSAGNWYLTRIRPYRSTDDRIDGVVLTFVDITGRKRTEAELLASEARLKEALDVKNEFLGLVSHELRTPLTSLVALTHTFSRGATEEDLREAAEILNQSVSRLQRMVENMLVLARLDLDERPPIEPVQLSRLVRRTVEAHEQRHPGRQLTLRDSTSQSIVDGHEGWIEQVLVNFLENAEKYAGDNAVVRVEISQSRTEIHVRVVDDGVGFTDQEALLLFEPFYRSPVNTHVPGAGLGLAVCRRLIELEGGRVWAQAGNNGGAEFGFALPHAEGSDRD